MHSTDAFGNVLEHSMIYLVGKPERREEAKRAENPLDAWDRMEEHARAEAALDGVIEELREKPVSARELEKAKNQTKANFVYAADGVTKLAQQIEVLHIARAHLQHISIFRYGLDLLDRHDFRYDSQSVPIRRMSKQFQAINAQALIGIR